MFVNKAKEARVVRIDDVCDGQRVKQMQVFHSNFMPLEWTVPHRPDNQCYAKVRASCLCVCVCVCVCMYVCWLVGWLARQVLVQSFLSLTHFLCACRCVTRYIYMKPSFSLPHLLPLRPSAISPAPLPQLQVITKISENHRVVGMHYLGPHAGEVIQGFSTGLR
jgi:hypothetical protein